MTELCSLQKEWKEYTKRTAETQQSVAAKLGIRQSALSLFLSGKLNLNAKFIIRISRLMGINPAVIRPQMEVFFGELKGKRLFDRMDRVLEALEGHDD